LRILIDMDGVCCDTSSVVLSRYNDEFGDNITPEQQTDFFESKVCLRAPPGYFNRMYASDGFFADLPVMPGCVSTLEYLYMVGHELVIVTAVPRSSRTGLYDKYNWVQKHLPFISLDNFVSTHRKDLVWGDIILDDSPKNLMAFPSITCAFTTAYNRNVKASYRIKRWEEFVPIINKLGF
jgi:5'-nucleotidase